MPRNLLWFTDDNIPSSGGDAPIIVPAPYERVILAESDQPVLTIFPQHGAGSLEIADQPRSYA